MRAVVPHCQCTYHVQREHTVWVVVAHVEDAGAGALVANPSFCCGQAVGIHLPIPGCGLGQVPLLQSA